jgi:tryptophan 2,3-dioxygenase
MSAGRTPTRRLTYWDYVRVDDLLGLQGGQGRDESRLSDAEVVFITVHQVYELWFKLVLRELVTLRGLFARPKVPEPELARAARGLDRITRIFRAATGHWDVVETLTTRDYLDFREHLFPASGFQSSQLREIEILMGLADADRVGLAADGAYLKALKAPDGGRSTSEDRVEARRKDRPTLREAVDAWLYRTPIRGSTPEAPGDAAAVDAFVEEYAAALEAQVARSASALSTAGPGDPRFDREREAARAFLSPPDPRRRRIRAAIRFVEGYRELPLLAWPQEVLARLVEVEQAFLIFRQRHARMVERVIGRRVGTGGSTGLDYLEQTATAYRIFGDLWAARTFLVPKSALPPLGDRRPYEFHAETAGA